MPSLRGLLDTLSLFLPGSGGPPVDPVGASGATTDDAFRDLPAAKWVPRAAIVIGTVRGSPVAGQSVTEGRIIEIAYLPREERSARLQVLVEEQRSMRSHRGLMGGGR